MKIKPLLVALGVCIGLSAPLSGIARGAPFCLTDAELRIVMLDVFISGLEATKRTCAARYPNLMTHATSAMRAFTSTYRTEIAWYREKSVEIWERVYPGIGEVARLQNNAAATAGSVQQAQAFTMQQCEYTFKGFEGFALVNDFEAVTRPYIDLYFPMERSQVPNC